MRFGPVPPQQLPLQNPSKILVLAERWQRSAWAQQRWAERGKQATDFFEGRQWTEKQIAEMRRQKRPALKFNIIAPLVRLVIGYHRSNKTDITFLPDQDARSSEQVAEALTRIEKVIGEGSHMDYVDTEVFLDGLLTGRGYYDSRLDFETNDLGEAKTFACDPFSVYLDPDADSYDLNENHSYVMQTKFVSLDEIDAWFGRTARDLLQPFILGQTPLAPISSLIIEDEISPVRTFGERQDIDADFWDSFYSLVGDFVDTRRRTIRLIDAQYKVVEPKKVMIDLETGDRKVLPDEWGNEHIKKIMLYAETVGEHIMVQNRSVERVQWTCFAGDIILYDQPSMYDTYSLTPYFPYFRRGMTRGMVEDLIDPQLEKNKRRSARIEHVSKTANGGWIYPDDAFDPVQERKLQQYGSAPGVNIKYKANAKKPPEQIQPNAPSVAHEKLEIEADQDMKEIAGVNEAALGQEMNVQSGRAIQAKQRQAVLGVQLYMDNLKRSKILLGKKHLEIVQAHYNEPRLYKIMGEDGHFVQFMINQAQQHPQTGVVQIANDIRVGKYKVVIDDTPISDTFLNAQFNEMLMILEKMGPAIGQQLPMFADLILDASSMPRKDEWIERLKAAQQQAQQKQQVADQQQQQWFLAELQRVMSGMPPAGSHYPQVPVPPHPSQHGKGQHQPHQPHPHQPHHGHGQQPHQSHEEATQNVVPFSGAPQQGHG